MEKHLAHAETNLAAFTGFVLWWSLEKDQAKLPGLHPENKQKMIDTPMAEQLLKAFADVSLTIDGNWGGHVAAADALDCVITRHPATARPRAVSLSTT